MRVTQMIVDAVSEWTRPQYPEPRWPLRLYQVWRLSQHWEQAQAGDYSFAGEAAHLRALLRRLKIEGGYVVDIAAGDGISQSSTLEFFRSPHWSGLAVEMDSAKFAKLAFAYAGFDGVHLAKCAVTPENVVPLLQAHSVPLALTLLNLDIDSYDLFVLQQMLEAGFQPRVISMEINESIPPPVYFTVTYNPTHFWEYDRFFGCSAAAAATVVKPFGYALESIQYNNAMFVHQDVAADGIADQDVSTAYRVGYVERGDRKALFPWNADVEDALSMPRDQAVEFFRTLFAKYNGMYELR